ncbi:MAG: hypothetical protein RL742_20 [Bacteroidota bacterium]|jgi:hypothetical protein
MFNKNVFFAGFLLGFLLPAVGFLLLYNLFNLLEIKGAASTQGLSPDFRIRTLALVALALNLIPLQIYRRRRWETAMRGVVVATGVLAIAWVLFFGVRLLD